MMQSKIIILFLFLCSTVSPEIKYKSKLLHHIKSTGDNYEIGIENGGDGEIVTGFYLYKDKIVVANPAQFGVYIFDKNAKLLDIFTSKDFDDRNSYFIGGYLSAFSNVFRAIGYKFATERRFIGIYNLDTLSWTEIPSLVLHASRFLPLGQEKLLVLTTEPNHRTLNVIDSSGQKINSLFFEDMLDNNESILFGKWIYAYSVNGYTNLEYKRKYTVINKYSFEDKLDGKVKGQYFLPRINNRHIGSIVGEYKDYFILGLEYSFLVYKIQTNGNCDFLFRQRLHTGGNELMPPPERHRMNENGVIHSMVFGDGRDLFIYESTPVEE